MHWFRRVARLLPLIPMIVLCSSCSDFWVSDSAIASVAVSPTAVILKAATGGTTPVAGDTYTLAASATTVGGTTTDETAASTWTSSAPTVVTANAGNLSVVATAADQTSVITATFGGQSSTCNVLTYTGTPPTTININIPTGISTGAMSPGLTFRLTATAALSGNSTHDVTSYVTWMSNDATTATIDANGNVTVLSTATAGGNFTITATAYFAAGTVTGTSASFSLPSI